MAENWAREFDAMVARKTRRATAAAIPAFVTTMLGDHAGLTAIGNAWSRELFDGPFYVRDPGPIQPSVSLVIVQSLDGNTVADDPAALGGGLTDQHLVYEGLSRVAADAVLAGARTVGPRTFFSVWHPALVDLRGQLGKPRHPAQLIVTGSGGLDLEQTLIANSPGVDVFVFSTSAGAGQMEKAARERPWVHVIDCGAPLDLGGAFRRLQERGLRTISAVGGRATASTLLQQGLVSDLYLTISPVPGGDPDTPLDLPSTTPQRLVLAKAGREQEEGVRFEHWELCTTGVPF